MSNKESSLRSLSLLQAPVYYAADHLGVDAFIQPEVVQRLVRGGSMVALSQGTFIDRDNVVAVLPSGECCSSTACLTSPTCPPGGMAT